MGPAPTEDSPNRSYVPKLLPNGANWISYKSRVIVALGSKGLLRNLEGRAAPKPKPPVPLPSSHTATEAKAHKKAVEEYDALLDDWEAREYSAQQQIFSTISDSILIRIQNLKSAAEMWTVLKRDFEGRTQVVQNDLR
ncbi:hypothetical protein EDB92DRAFT_1802202, partial [Lactarius akahatsu]